MRVTQAQIARRVGLSVSSVSKILRQSPDGKFSQTVVDRVFAVAQELGYEPGRLKHPHRRRHPRKLQPVLVELAVYRADGVLYDRGIAWLQDVSLSGARLSAVMLPQGAIPLEPHTIGLRILRGPHQDLEVLGRLVRFEHLAGGLEVGIEFLESEVAKMKKIRRII